MTTKGLMVGIYKQNGKSYTQEGSFTKLHNDYVIVVGEDIPEIFEGTDENTLVLMRGNLPYTAKLVPYTLAKGEVWTMYGGCYADSSDGRWHQAVEKICGSRQSGAVPIHDRVER